MRIDTHLPLKTLGPQAARLVTILYERGRRVFTLADVRAITGLKSNSARSFARKLVDRAVTSRLGAGLYTLVPVELGREREYLGNPFAVAREIMRGKPYYVSHGSAMDIHGMLTQPQLRVYVSSPHPMRPRTILGTEFRFVRCPRARLFGLTLHWVDKQEQVRVSDIERTVLDGLKQPEYCGGFSQVAKGFWMRRAEVNVKKLVDYAVRLNVGAVFRRLGYLLEACEIDAPNEMERLRSRLTKTYLPVDPLLPSEGRYLARWRVRMNVTPEEIHAAVGT